MTCPHCRFPIHPTQPALRVHTGTSRVNGVMVDHRPLFHQPCAAQHLAAVAHRYTRQRNPGTGLGIDPATGQPHQQRKTA